MANRREILKSENGFGLKELHEKLRLPDDEFEEWFKDIGLLHRAKKCSYDNHAMLERVESGRLKWLCRQKSVGIWLHGDRK